MADASDLDGATLPLVDAVGFALMHEFGLVLSCLPGELAVYKAEWATTIFVFQQ